VEFLFEPFDVGEEVEFCLDDESQVFFETGGEKLPGPSFAGWLLTDFGAQFWVRAGQHDRHKTIVH